MLNRQNIVQTQFKLHLVPEIKSFLQAKDNPYTDVPMLNIYYLVFLTLTENKKEEHYKKLVVLLEKHAPGFLGEESRAMYRYAQNYCIRKINSGKSNYFRELFELYKTQLESEVIFENKYLDHTDYKNIVTVALRLPEFELSLIHI